MIVSLIKINKSYCNEIREPKLLFHNEIETLVGIDANIYNLFPKNERF